MPHLLGTGGGGMLVGFGGILVGFGGTLVDSGGFDGEGGSAGRPEKPAGDRPR